mgnify:CR=1 FL=1
MELKVKILQYCLITLLAFSCSYYSFKGSLPSHINNINVSPIVNNSTEYLAMDILESEVYNTLLKENILKLVELDSANSKLDIIINSVTDKPYTYSSNSQVVYEIVDEWRITIKAKISWYDLSENRMIFSKEISSFGIYSTIRNDISNDGLDNDSDGLIDSDDDDEYGPPRDSAIKIAAKKLSENIIANINSTW